jgi:predicted nucleic acid-binding protein
VASEGTLVDTNVLIDVLTADPSWGAWSRTALAAALERGPLLINPVIYAEVSVRFASIEELDAALPADVFERAALPFRAGFLAGKAFARYRERGGERSAPLPDFFIGAHALIAGHRLLTRDAARYRSYFPRLTVIAPQQ